MGAAYTRRVSLEYHYLNSSHIQLTRQISREEEKKNF